MNSVYRRIAHSRITLVGLLASVSVVILFSLAGWLRWQYATQTGIHVDEFNTLWAARQVLERGVPVMPSGVLYPRGLFSTYLIAALAAVSRLDYLIGRLPSLLFGLAAVGLIYRVGHVIWNWRVGLLALLGLALLPGAIESSGRARFYAPLLFWSLLALWFFLQALEAGSDDAEGRRRQWLLHLAFAISFILAILSQEAVVLLYPALLVCAYLWRGWRYFCDAASISAHLMIVAALGGRLLFDLVGQAGQLAMIQASTPYVQLTPPDLTVWLRLLEPTLAGSHWPWTVGAGITAVGVGVQLLRAKGGIAALHRDQRAALYWLICWGFVLAMVLLIIGDEWRHPRYLLFIQPYLLLPGAAGIGMIIDRVSARADRTALLTVVVVGGLFWALWPAAVRETRRELPGYAQAFAYVAHYRAPNDAVVSPQATACAYVLQTPCTYYATQSDFEPYVIFQDGRWVDRWTGTPLLNTKQQLDTLLAQSPRVWFVTDGDRLLHRYDQDFMLTVVEQFDVVYEASTTRVLVAEGWRSQPPYQTRTRYDPPLDVGGPDLVSLAHSEIQPLANTYLELWWRQLDEYDEIRINTSVQWVTAAGERVAQADGPLARNLIFPSEAGGSPVPDLKRLYLPVLPSGWHRLEVTAYDAVSLEPFGPPVPLYWYYFGPPPRPPQVTLRQEWHDGLQLVGHDALPTVLSPDGTVELRLIWSAVRSLAANYNIFVHLVDENDVIISQSDHAPLANFLPTGHWLPGFEIEDRHSLPLDDSLRPSVYSLRIGWYQLETGERLQLAGGGDHLTLASWTVDEPKRRESP